MRYCMIVEYAYWVWFLEAAAFGCTSDIRQLSQTQQHSRLYASQTLAFAWFHHTILHLIDWHPVSSKHPC